ncbi:putative THUMP domain-containing protein 1 [Apostichopus japonicus]|uniref:Putative THUMP domain-containing protein 1 n=1 Tax=Stichopus japonicus TaxID=307972 RepID=A0A2G8KP41_STIJA|nr:putative THUMP domain-containing protein 1 [Apostichopus japonicus]
MASAGRRGHKGGTKRSKSYFRKCTSGKRSRWERKLDVGMKGVLITCNRDEKQCIREAYDLLTEYADELYGNEVDVDSVMINDDPSNMVHHVLTKMKEQGKCKSKHIQRILPVSMTCRASLTQIEKAIKPLLEPFFHSDEAKDSTFAILFKARNNNQVQRGEVITVVANAVTSGSKCKHSVDLDDPDYSILVEVVCNVCCLSVLRDYNSLKKYNVRAIVGEEPSQVSRSQPGEKAESKQNACKVDNKQDIVPEDIEKVQRDKITSKSDSSLDKDHKLVAIQGEAEIVCRLGETKPEAGSLEEKQDQMDGGIAQDREDDDAKIGIQQSLEKESTHSEPEEKPVDEGIRIF